MDFKYFVFIVLILYRKTIAEENSEDTEIYKMSDRVYMCSTWLSSVIENFCNNVYKIVKRDTSAMLDKLAPKDLLRNRNKKRQLTEVKRRRARRQVASECCERPCTVGNIIMYCPEDAKLLIENPNIFD